MDFTLTDSEKRFLLRRARDVIESRLRGQPLSPREVPPALQQIGGAFVTLHSGAALRGCIGHIIGRYPLYQTVEKMARASAFEDPRFPPLTEAEYSGITIEISLLSPLRPLTDPEALKPGEHGLLITARGRSGVFLPQVATEQGWGRRELLEQVCYKAGLPAGAWKDSEAELQIFTALVFSEEDIDSRGD